MTTIQVTLDCVDPHSQADWWAETLGWDVEPSDPEFIRRMIAEGRAEESDTVTHRGNLVWAAGAGVAAPESSGQRVRLLFQVVPEAKGGKNRMHLDVHIDPGVDRDQARDALVARGASLLWEASQGPFRWYTMADPEGNEFCLA